jgi:branched-chain amino acid transport system ATP-binding protein
VLKLSNIDTFYGPIQALHDVSLRVEAGEIVSLLGGNACGKSTTMKTILGLVRPRRGAANGCHGQGLDGPSQTADHG